MKNLLIIDDEFYARERVKEFLGYSDLGANILESGSGKDAIHKINKFSPKLIFLDLDLQDMYGFEVLDHSDLGYEPFIICITASEIDAITAYEYHISDYLLKPYTLQRFKTAIERAASLIKLKEEKNGPFEVEAQIQAQKEYLENIPVKKRNTTQLIDTSTILYFLSDQHYIELVCGKKKYLIRETMSGLEEKLNPKDFLRIYRSTIINKNFLEEVIHCDYSDIQLKMTDGRILKVGRSYRKNVVEILNL